VARWRSLVGGALLLAAVLINLGVGPNRWHQLPSISKPEYGYHEAWARYLAPSSACPASDDTDAPVEAQQQTMLCLINFARRVEGVRGLHSAPLLMRAAALKAMDIVNCRDYRHEACGKPAEAAAVAAGYPAGRPGVRFGENLNWGAPAVMMSPRAALDSWLDSPGHRANLLDPAWTETGIRLVIVEGPLKGRTESRIWINEFGSR
jgi:uncharacterized protein YkwD